MIDGIQAVTGATYGKVLMSKLFYGKLAATFYHPSKGAVRFALKPEFLDEMGKFEFFTYRKRGVEPSGIPEAVTNEVIQWIFGLPDYQVFIIEPKPDFQFAPVKGSFNKDKCSVCGEYVFERYLRVKDGKHVCIPCSGYEKK